MGISSHQIEHEFPDHQETIRTLKASDPEFRDKAERYMELDRKIEGLERRDGPISDDKMNQLKSWRARLKDEIYARLCGGGS